MTSLIRLRKGGCSDILWFYQIQFINAECKMVFNQFIRYRAKNLENNSEKPVGETRGNYRIRRFAGSERVRVEKL